MKESVFFVALTAPDVLQEFALLASGVIFIVNKELLSFGRKKSL